MRPLPAELETYFKDLLQQHDLTEHHDLIRSHARLSFQMRVNALSDPSSAPLGASRLGGTPDLPGDLNWARNPDDGKLLDFVGQINLADVPQCGQLLPTAGRLFIYTLQESAAENPHTIQYSAAADSALIRAAAPTEEELSDENSDAVFGSLLITDFVPALALPDSSVFDDQDDGFHAGYYDLIEQLCQHEGQDEPISRLLGYPMDLAGSALPSEDWELLVQIESHFSDGECYMNFWDAGSLQLIVKHADLPTCQFSQSNAGIASM